MERSRNKLVVVLLIFCLIKIQANYKTEIYNSFISNDMQNWKRIIVQMQAAKPTQTAVLSELVNYQYGYIAFCLGTKEMEEAEKYLDIAENNLSVLESMKFNTSMVNAYKAAFIGYRISLKPWKAPYIGGKSMDCATLAVQQDANNPMGYMQLGNIEYYKPPVFGGSKMKAITSFLIAKNLMEKNKNEIDKNWMYLNLLTLLGIAYSEIENYKESQNYYQKTLKIEPNYMWVKNKLYPELLQKIKSKS